MKILKGYVRNWTRLEGYIDECYIIEEAIEFCSKHLSGTTTIDIIRDSIDMNLTNRGLNRVVVCTFNCEQRDQVHRNVL